jgi:type II secretory pathway pseudopilin PulG
VTLLELVVVIALMGLLFAIAAPSLIFPEPKPEAELTRVLETARRTAILRSEPVTLSFDSDGAWRIDGDASPTAPPVVSGTLRSAIGRLRIRVSAIGTCVADPGGAAQSASLSFADCRVVAANASERAR